MLAILSMYASNMIRDILAWIPGWVWLVVVILVVIGYFAELGEKQKTLSEQSKEDADRLRSIEQMLLEQSNNGRLLKWKRIGQTLESEYQDETISIHRNTSTALKAPYFVHFSKLQNVIEVQSELDGMVKAEESVKGNCQ